MGSIPVRHDLRLSEAAALDLLLHSLEGLLIYDRIVAVLDVDLTKLTSVFPLPFGTEILMEKLLQ